MMVNILFYLFHLHGLHIPILLIFFTFLKLAGVGVLWNRIFNFMNTQNCNTLKGSDDFGLGIVCAWGLVGFDKALIL